MSKPLTDKELAHLRGLYQYSIPGPWKREQKTHEDSEPSYGIGAPAPHWYVVPPLNLDPKTLKLICAMHAALPRLLDEIETLRRKS